MVLMMAGDELDPVFDPLVPVIALTQKQQYHSLRSSIVTTFAGNSSI